MQQNVTNWKKELPDIPFREEVIAWWKEVLGKGLYTTHCAIAEYCFNSTQPINADYHNSIDEFNRGRGYQLRKVHGPCHALWNVAVDKTTTFVCAAFSGITHQSHARPFLEWILSPTESPWRAVLQDAVILRDKNNDMFPLAVLLTNVQTANIKLLSNFLIATRLQNYWSISPVWNHVRTFGFTNPEALLLALNYKIFRASGDYHLQSSVDYTDVDIIASYETANDWNPSKRFQQNYYTIAASGFYPMDQPFNSRLDPYRFINALPDVQDNMTLEKGVYPKPCNQIWDGVRSKWVWGDMFGFSSRNLITDIPSSKIEELKRLMNTKNCTEEIRLTKSW